MKRHPPIDPCPPRRVRRGREPRRVRRRRRNEPKRATPSRPPLRRRHRRPAATATTMPPTTVTTVRPTTAPPIPTSAPPSTLPAISPELQQRLDAVVAAGVPGVTMLRRAGPNVERRRRRRRRPRHRRARHRRHHAPHGQRGEDIRRDRGAATRRGGRALARRHGRAMAARPRSGGRGDQHPSASRQPQRALRLHRGSAGARARIWAASSTTCGRRSSWSQSRTNTRRTSRPETGAHGTPTPTTRSSG